MEAFTHGNGNMQILYRKSSHKAIVFFSLIGLGPFSSKNLNIGNILLKIFRSAKANILSYISKILWLIIILLVVNVRIPDARVSMAEECTR